MSESDEIEAAVSRAVMAGPGHVPDPTEPRLLRDALGRYATGVAVVTAREEGDGGPVGITINSFASVSLDPALVLWSAARTSARYRHFVAAQAYAIHVLRADQRSLADRFIRADQAFEDFPYRVNEAGVPLIEGTLARFECSAETRHEGGDHTILIGRVTRFELCREGEPLCFFGGGYGRFAPGL